MSIIIKEVNSTKEFRTFYQFQNKLYKNCNEYVPTLDMDQKATLEKDPALSYCTRKLWLAYKEGRVVGRIQAIVNPKYNATYGSKHLRFGWFDFENDIEIAKALLDTATKWGKEQGMTKIHGPLAYNALGRQGMLCEGFENLPPTNCLYNYPYYIEFMDKLGYKKEMDWLQLKLNASQGAPDKLVRMSEILMKRYNLKFLDIKTVKGEAKKELAKKFFAAYNEAFKNVPNFVAFTDEEIEATGATYFKLLRDELTCIVIDDDGDIAAFGICFPSLSKSFQKAKGKLFPFGWYHIYREFNNYDTIDLMIVGSSPKWASKGLSAIYHAHLAASFKKHNIQSAITNPQSEDNNAAIKVWESYDSEPYMRRRSWIKDIE